MNHAPAHRQRGYVLVLVMTALSIAAGFLLNAVTDLKSLLERKERYQSVLAEAREALIAYAITYRDTHPSAGPAYTEVYGFLPCPDTMGNGDADPTCGASDVSVIGRLPWRTLGLASLRDGAGECLWYAVSGHGKNNPPTAAPNAMNWDTTGQFNLYDTTNNLRAGSILTSGAPLHTRPLAIVFAANAPLAGQARNGGIAGECPGNTTIRNYLDALTDPNHPDPLYGGTAPAANALSNLTVAAPGATYNNDQALTLMADEIFGRIQKRVEFKTDIDTLLTDYTNCLNTFPIASLPVASATNKGIDNIATLCPPTKFSLRRQNVITQWRNNLLYAKPASSITVNGQSCSAVLFFGGQRTAAQSRATTTEIAASGNYLEGANAAFPNAPAYTGNIGFNFATPSTDLARCIIGLPAGATQKSTASDLGVTNIISTAPIANTQTLPDGTSVQTQTDGTVTKTKPDGTITVTNPNQTVTLNLTDKTISIMGTGSMTGGCVWFPDTLPLAGKTLRAFFRFQFSTGDDSSIGGSGSDRGNGMTLELVRSDMGSPANYCGNTKDMGVLGLGSFGLGGTIGLTSFIFENDVHEDSGHSDPGGNHIATLQNGNLTHSPTNGYTTTACNGSAAGCLLTPRNTLEETPTPSQHTERIEITTGCNNACSACTPASHAAPNNYVRIRTWIDCIDCFDVTQDFLQTPNTQACQPLDPNLNTPYFGFTGGFRNGTTTSQGVLIQDFVVRTQ